MLASIRRPRRHRGPDEVAATTAAYGWDHPPFHVPPEVADHLDARERGAALRARWEEAVRAHREAQPELAEEFDRRVVRGVLPDDWTEVLPAGEGSAATRTHSGAVINALAPTLPELFGGSADLAVSNSTDVVDGGDVSVGDRLGRNLRVGVREHAMAAIANGRALHHGLLPDVASSLVSTDHCRPALRLASLLRAGVVDVLTRDSIALGEDGTTHQPVEHLARLRAMPGVTVWRPADSLETVVAWRAAIWHGGPSVLALTRQHVADLGARDAADISRGGEVLHDVTAAGTGGRPSREADAEPQVVLIGTGCELHLCVQAADLHVRVVSMPAVEVFLGQDPAYQRSVFPPQLRARVAEEAAASFGWERIVGAAGSSRPRACLREDRAPRAGAGVRPAQRRRRFFPRGW